MVQYFKRNCELLEGGDGGEVVVVVDFVVSFLSHHNVETISLPRHDPKSRSIGVSVQVLYRYYNTVHEYARVLGIERRLKVQRDKLFLFIAKNFKFSFSSSPHVLLLRHTVLL